MSCEILHGSWQKIVASWWFVANANSKRYGGWNWPILFEKGGIFWPAKTPLSKKNILAAKEGDLAFCYAAGDGWRKMTALASTGEITQSASQVSIFLKPIIYLERPVPRKLLKSHPDFVRAQPMVNRFGSVFKLRATEARAVIQEVVAHNPELKAQAAEWVVQLEL